MSLLLLGVGGVVSGGSAPAAEGYFHDAYFHASYFPNSYWL